MELMCFLFGHSIVSRDMQEIIDQAVEDFYHLGFTIFAVGYHGEFDRMATSALRKLKKKHPDVTLFLVTPYHPVDHEIDTPEEFDLPFYPPGMETVPRKFCIVRANQYMIRNSHGVICYVDHPGNARNLFEKINRNNVLVRNVAWEKGYKNYPGYMTPEAEEVLHKLRKIKKEFKSPFV